MLCSDQVGRVVNGVAVVTGVGGFRPCTLGAMGEIEYIGSP